MSDTLLPSPLIVGNWKMNTTRSSAVELARVYVETAETLTGGGGLWLSPPNTSLSSVYEVTRGTSVAMGAQNVHWKSDGAFTGEVSVPMIREEGCTFAIVGHSERRRFFGDTNETVAKRARTVLSQGLTCLLCVGEGIEERIRGATHQVLREQLRTALFDSAVTEDESEKQQTPQEMMGRLIVAYEPVWAIGTGKVAAAEEIEDAHEFIRAFLREKTGIDTTLVLYGGSVKGNNIADILAIPGVSGALVGGASLIPDEVRLFGAAVCREE